MKYEELSLENNSVSTFEEKSVGREKFTTEKKEKIKIEKKDILKAYVEIISSVAKHK